MTWPTAEIPHGGAALCCLAAPRTDYVSAEDVGGLLCTMATKICVVYLDRGWFATRRTDSTFVAATDFRLHCLDFHRATSRPIRVASGKRTGSQWTVWCRQTGRVPSELALPELVTYRSDNGASLGLQEGLCIQGFLRYVFVQVSRKRKPPIGIALR